MSVSFPFLLPFIFTFISYHLDRIFFIASDFNWFPSISLSSTPFHWFFYGEQSLSIAFPLSSHLRNRVSNRHMTPLSSHDPDVVPGWKCCTNRKCLSERCKSQQWQILSEKIIRNLFMDYRKIDDKVFPRFPHKPNVKKATKKKHCDSFRNSNEK